ncbi:site-specific DNA-methyltransferase [Polyangium aurulentum]|uniref:site-specific DNA-methyltransferase n=1 Tax=Polyangium aurulentum TaxID=2567896 RepID=UPI001F3B1BB8|nr:site-specific DNA-methyltransferase [Polyangium aurulentum]
MPSPPRRHIVQAEALAWLDANPAEPGTSVITSLPDVSEVAELGFEGWRGWFVGAARRILRWIPPDGVAIFFQSDIRHHGVWVDKGYLVARAAEEEAASLVWHKIVLRKEAGFQSYGRATYSHMLCISQKPRPLPTRPSPDVLPDAGFKPWSRAMGVEACRLACRYLLEETATRIVVDPFCGHGTALAVANALGLDAIGIDIGARKCRAARNLVIDLEAPPGPSR